MGVKITGRNYTDRFSSGTTNWLLGNVGDWQRVVINCEASVDFFPSQSESVTIDQVQNTFTLNNGKRWNDYGFDIGQILQIKATYVNDDTPGENVRLFIYTISNIYGSVLEVAQEIEVVDGLFTLPSNYGTKSVFNITFWSNVEPEGARIVYGHIPNADFQNGILNSVIDSTTTEFVKPDVITLPDLVFSQMEAVGLQSGMSIRECVIIKAGKKPDTLNTYVYEFHIQYLISSFFGTQADLESKTMPEYLTGDGSLTDNFLISFFPKWNNPNTVIRNTLNNTARLGNTGWFDENFNQLVNDYKVEFLTYKDQNGNPTTGIDYFATTRVTAIVRGVQNITTNSEFGFGFMWVPKYEEDYKNNTIPFYRNTFVNAGDVEDGFKAGTFYPDTIIGGGVGSAWMEVKNVQFQNLGGGDLYFEAFFTPSPGFSLLFDEKEPEDRKYILWLSVADTSLTRNFSDRVSLLADYNDLIKTIPPAGPYPFMQNVFIEHPYESNVVGVEEYDGFSQDDVLCRIPFQVDPTTTDVRRMSFGIEIFNISTNERRVLENRDVDMTQFYSDVNGIPQYNLNTTRGFKLGNDNNKNWFKINREPNYDSTGKYGYLAFYAFKIRYEDWIPLSGMPNDFFSPTELNNGFNNDWYHYITTAGWRVNFYVETTAVVDGVLVQYRNRFNFKFKDYDQSDKVTAKHSYFRDSDDTYLNIGTDPETQKPLGVILSNELTRIEIEYEILDSGLWDLEKVYGTTTIEVDRGAGIMQMRQISSVWASEPDNPLIPLQGETRLKLSVDGTGKFLTTSCLVDPDLLDNAQRYRVTGRVGCYDATGVIRFGIYEGRYENKYE